MKTRAQFCWCFYARNANFFPAAFQIHRAIDFQEACKIFLKIGFWYNLFGSIIFIFHVYEIWHWESVFLIVANRNPLAFCIRKISFWMYWINPLTHAIESMPGRNSWTNEYWFRTNIQKYIGLISVNWIVEMTICICRCNSCIAMPDKSMINGYSFWVTIHCNARKLYLSNVNKVSLLRFELW